MRDGVLVSQYKSDRESVEQDWLRQHSCMEMQ